MSCVLDRRIQDRLLSLMVGALFGQGRRTVASWLRAGELGDEFRLYYYFLGSLGRNVKSVAGVLLRRALRVIVPGDRLLFAIDDTATKRQGPWVEGAGIHHNPTPGAAENKFLYGHVWVVLSWVVRHSLWGTIALPILAMLYVRQKNLKSIPPWYKVKFQTKLEQAVDLVVWLVQTLAFLEKTVWIVVDGGYVKRPFLRPVLLLGVIVVGRLRKDAALHTVPDVVDPKKRKRGQPRKYGKDRISLAKRAGHREGWQTDEFVLYNKKAKKTYKTFLATYEPVGGAIRVVLVKEKHGWFAYFCSKPDASVQEILEAVADRAAIEQNFHDVKEVHGAGQQQLRNYYANIAAFHVTLWWHTLIELWAWHKPQDELTDRSASPWDKEPRRPSHADRRNALRRQSLANEFSRDGLAGSIGRKIQSLWNRLANLVV
ncbi:MAG: transposase [Planctomycetota bacterium]